MTLFGSVVTSIPNIFVPFVVQNYVMIVPSGQSIINYTLKSLLKTAPKRSHLIDGTIGYTTINLMVNNLCCIVNPYSRCTYCNWTICHDCHYSIDSNSHAMGRRWGVCPITRQAVTWGDGMFLEADIKKEMK